MDEQQRYIISIIRYYEKVAYKGSMQNGQKVGLMQEFPILEEQVKIMLKQIQDQQDEVNDNYLKSLID